MKLSRDLISRLPILTLTLALFFSSLSRAEQGLRWDKDSSPLSPSRDGLSVVWWNIEHGLTNEKVGQNDLGHNLSELARDPNSPDIIALGEFRKSSVDPVTREVLENRYRPYFIPYNPESEGMGLMVYAKKDIAVEESSPRVLDWVPPGLSPSDETRYRERWAKNFPDWVYFTRAYTRFRFRRGNKVLNFVPLHLIQPWEKIKNDFGPLGTAAAALALYLGRHNPMMHQIANIRRELTTDFGEKLSREPLLVVGDLNLTRGAPAYRMLSRGLKPAFPKSISTFPSLDAGRHGLYPSLQIDHAFVSKGIDVESARVLPLRGSDHYALALGVGGPALEVPTRALGPISPPSTGCRIAKSQLAH